MTRYDIINEFIRARDYKYFLEIGTAGGETYRNVIAPVRISVDPNFQTMASYRMTSNEFFGLGKLCMSFDIVFVDGLHTCDQAYADINNSLRILNSGGVIVIHDCLPTSELMQSDSVISCPGGIWTGDVWKAFIKLRTELPYLMYTINTDYGCGIIDTTQRRTEVPILPWLNMHEMSYDLFDHNKGSWMNITDHII